MTATESLNSQVATAVRIELARRNLTQAQLAKMCGLTESTFSRRMSGEIPWSADEIDQLALALEVPVFELTNPVQR